MITRIAPSPTGYFHLGTLRTAYLNWLAARSQGGRFVLRIDDTDKNRSKEEYIDYIYKIMNKYELDYDTTFLQSSNIELYKQKAAQLISLEKAVKKNGAIILSGDIPIVLIKSDEMPTYNFSSTIDDAELGITHIIRGTDHISNLTIQETIWNLLYKTPFPIVKHVGLLFEHNKKLSKREGNGNIEIYKDFNIDAVLNWVLRYGWSMPNPNFDKEFPLVDKQLAKELFWKGNLQTNSSSIDINKLRWYNKKYLINKY